LDSATFAAHFVVNNVSVIVCGRTTNVAPQGLDILAQGRAQRRQPRSVALGCGARGIFALQGQGIRERSVPVDPGVRHVSPLQGIKFHRRETQGDAPRLSPLRFALG